MDRAEADRPALDLDARTRSLFDSIDIFPEIPSTNSYLLGQTPPRPGRASAALADHQTAGRGRLENRWHSPPGSGLYLSLAYTFASAREDLPSLTLAAGVALLHALEDVGVAGAMLKWPNDIVLNDGKLGGILTELQPSAAATPTVVVGAGLNIDMRGRTDDIVAGIGRIADLREALESTIEPLQLASTVLARLLHAIVVFDRAGLEPFVTRWRERDWLAEKAVRVDTGQAELFGIAAGVDTDGALLLRQGEDLVRVISGSVVPDEAARR